MSAGFDRLQEFLLAMRVGDEVRALEAADLSGLSPETCRTVLEGLSRAGLMTPKPDGRYVRRSLDVVGV